MQPPPSCLRSDLDAVYVLSRCLYYHTLPPPLYIQVALTAIGKEWTQANYDMAIQCYLRFTRKLDLQAIASLSHQILNDDRAMCEFPLKSFSLREDDRARYYGLSSFTDREVRLRLSLIQFFNQCLLRVVHLVDLVPSGRDQETNTLGQFISGLTGYIFPFVKESFLELLISQTVYRGKDAYPIVELDNRRVYTDMERSMEMSDDGETRSALTSQCFFAQLFRQLQSVPVDVLRASFDSRERLLAVKYKGEQGLDWGGLYRDTIERWYDNDNDIDNDNHFVVWKTSSVIILTCSCLLPILKRMLLIMKNDLWPIPNIATPQMLLPCMESITPLSLTIVIIIVVIIIIIIDHHSLILLGTPLWVI